MIFSRTHSFSHLSVKRNTRSLSCDASVSVQHKRQIVIRLRAVSLGAHSEVTFREDTGLLKLSLGTDEVTHTHTHTLCISYVMYIVHVCVCVKFNSEKWVIWGLSRSIIFMNTHTRTHTHQIVNIGVFFYSAGTLSSKTRQQFLFPALHQCQHGPHCQ